MVSAALLDSRHPIVGREREQAQLRQILDEAVGGHGNLILLSGEAGIGKTTLVNDLIAAAREQGCLVLAGGCYDLTTTAPYAPWFEVFESYRFAVETSTLPDALDRQAEIDDQGAWFEIVRDAIWEMAADQTLLILLEDMHWSDPGSLDLLRYLSRQRFPVSLLLAVTFRDDEVLPERPLYQFLPILVREGAKRVELRPLDQAAVRDLVTGRYSLDRDSEARVLDYLKAFGEGNPLYITELLRSLEVDGRLRSAGGVWEVQELSSAPVPSLLRQLIEARVERLGQETPDALALASVIGEEVPVDLWLAVSVAGEEAVSEAMARSINAHILVERSGGQRLRFGHALIREALYLGLSPLRRRRLHRRVAEALLSLPGVDPDAVAFHFQQASDPRAFEWLLRAGLRARRSAAWISAADRFKRAATLIEDDPERDRDRGWLLYYAALLGRFSGRDDIIEDLDEALRLAATAGDTVLSAYAHSQRAVARVLRGEIRKGLQDFEEATKKWKTLPYEHRMSSDDDEEIAFVAALIAGRSIDFTGSHEAERETGPAAIPSQGYHINWLAMAGRYRDALELGEHYLDELEAKFGDEHLTMRGTLSGLLGLAQAQAMLGRHGEARRLFRIARAGFIERAETSMIDSTAFYELTTVITPYYTDLVETRRCLTEIGVEAWGSATGMTVFPTTSSQCELVLAMLEGRWQEARRIGNEQIQPASLSDWRQLAQATLGTLAWHQGETDLAWRQIRLLFPDGPETQPGDCHFQIIGPAQRIAAGIAMDGGNLELARQWIDAHQRWLGWSGAVVGRAELGLLRARHARARGDSAEARREAEKALERASEPRQPLALIAIHRFLGQLDTDAGQHADAAAHLETSLDLAGTCELPYERALTLLELADLQAKVDDRDEVETLLAQAREICGPLDARPTLARVDEIAQQFGKARDDPGSPAGLSPREIDVLRLVVQGLTDAEIAGQLDLSPRTVQSYLRSVYNKLGVNSRTAAAGFAIREGIA